MMIDRNAAVTPNRYESPLLRRTIGRRIGRADRDDMLRAFLWASEVRIADEVAAAWRELHEDLKREVRDAERREGRLGWKRSDQVAIDCHAAAGELLTGLREESRSAAEAVEHCAELTGEFQDCLGLDLKVRRDTLADVRIALAALNDDLPAARERFRELLNGDRTELQELADLERTRLDATGPTLQQMDEMQQDQFDAIVRAAMERSGFQALQRAPRVIEVFRDDAKWGLVYCAHTHNPGPEGKIDVRDLATAQRLATDGDFNGVLMVSNLQYISRAGLRYIPGMTCSVKRMHRFELQQWIEWNMPLRALKVA
ncbi:hypothetical protein [Streptomyces sp. NPDC048272]|uniref:hypothetical protein n=1 Tax=Streptomyces sp. NPDC048272 TaxID=3154616 RepID=UPI00341CBBF5